jgi:hypothetical protein
MFNLKQRFSCKVRLLLKLSGMKRLIPLILLAILISCEKQEIESIDCEVFISGLGLLDENIVKTEIEKLTVDLTPHPAGEDALGHSGNLQILVDRLNEGCSAFTASLLCYACIYTYPAQSELRISFYLNGNKEEVIIDIHTPENDILRFAGIHR